MLTRDERLTALITNLRQYEPKVQYYFQLESEDVPIILSILENLEKMEQEPTQSPIIDWNNCHTSEQLNSISATKNDLGVELIDRVELLKAMDTWDKFGYTETGCFVREPKGDYVPYVHYEDMVNCVKGMPSVTPQEPRIDFEELKRKILMEVDGGTDDAWLAFGEVCNRISNSIDEFVADMEEVEE